MLKKDKIDKAEEAKIVRNKSYEAGKCKRCNSRPRAENKTCCERCLEIMRRNVQAHQERIYLRLAERRRERATQGLCVECATPSPDSYYCRGCADLRNIHVRKTKALRAGDPLPDPQESYPPLRRKGRKKKPCQ